MAAGGGVGAAWPPATPDAATTINRLVMLLIPIR
jgi:hypothetical protein